ncbi:MAG: MBOAT family protein [Clostridia bacterium]|nr:MBOAT family protein [Clostridia bacterium]
MSFASIDFLIFFAVVLSGTVIIDKLFPQRVKEFFLLAASYFFYGYWDWRFCFLLLFVTVSSYFTAKYSHLKPVFITGVVVPLAVLGFFKYFNFFLGSAAAIVGKELGALRIILPVGISFYTFQALSYVIDVRRKKIPVETDFIKLALYISFFPQLVAGPIVRAADFLPQLRERRTVSVDNLKWGLQVFAFGLFKKIVLADHISVFVDDVYSKPAAFHWATIVFAAISYSLQIYFDFSGYSDMAIGCAKCLGYDFNKNFNLPYISQSATEFWRRWHISLSTWLKEYLYIPLGGNRKGKARQYINLMLTMLLGGLWHGANWTFVFWGGINGLALCLDKIRHEKSRTGILRAIKIVATFLFITFTWIFFRADSFSTAWIVIKGIFTLQDGIRQPFTWSIVALVLLVACSIAAEVKSRGEQTTNGYYPILNLDSVGGLTVFFTVLGLILALAYTGENPFVYFQF